jgi:hypothetical protein
MTRRHVTVCAEPGCPRLTDHGARCLEHSAPDRARRNARVAEYGYNREHWQTVRRQRLALAGYRCELQLDGCTEVASHVHLDPRLQGNHDAAQLHDTRACCASCSGAIDAPRATYASPWGTTTSAYPSTNPRQGSRGSGMHRSGFPSEGC